MEKWPRAGKAGLWMQGVLFGVTAMLGILSKVSINGVIYDGRSVVLSLAAWYFGWRAALVAGVMAAGLRVWMGGAGTVGGIGVIVTSCVAGLLFRRWIRPEEKKIRFHQMLALGIVVHVLMLLVLELLLPATDREYFIRHILLPVMVFYPMATLLAGRILADQQANRLALAELQDSELRFKNLFLQNQAVLQTATNGYWMMDIQGKLLETNDSYCRMSGYTREEILTMRVPDLDADEVEAVFQSILQTLQEKGNLRLERRHRRKNGTLLLVEVNALCIQTSEGPRICAFFRDITEEREQQKMRRLHSAALAAAANTVVITDTAGCVEWANEAFTRSTGYTLQESLGRRPGELINSGHHDEAFYRKLWETIQRGDVWRGEIINQCKDGHLLHEHMTITPVFAETGKISHFIAIKEDLSEQKRLEKLFLRSQRLESIGTLSGGVAHDLNNILAPIVMFADLLSTELPAGEQRKMAEMIALSATRGAGVVRQLLTFARGAEGGKQELQVSHVLRETLKVYEETFPKNIRIVDRVERGLWTVNADPTQINQVLTNLMVNARDAMPTGGRVEVGAVKRKVEVEWARQNPPAKEGAYVVITVEDTGVGIPEDILDKIFDPFFTTKGPGKGTGLGLSTSLGIVRGHGGFMLVNSTPGVGSRFEVFLPALCDGLEDAPLQPSMPPRGNGECVLVVDDEESIRFMLRGILESLGYRAELASDGQEALNRLSRGPAPSLMILDLVMPGVGGVEVLAVLKERSDAPPVVLISGMPPDEGSDGNQLHGKPFLGKPFTVDALARKLRDVLDSAGS